MHICIGRCKNVKYKPITIQYALQVEIQKYYLNYLFLFDWFDGAEFSLFVFNVHKSIINRYQTTKVQVNSKLFAFLVKYNNINFLNLISDFHRLDFKS